MTRTIYRNKTFFLSSRSNLPIKENITERYLELIMKINCGVHQDGRFILIDGAMALNWRIIMYLRGEERRSTESNSPVPPLQSDTISNLVASSR